MGTRCVVSVIGEDNTFHIYRHCDGYPGDECGVLETFKLALPYAWHFSRFDPCDMAAAIIRAWKDSSGHIYLTSHYDVHGDLSYRYEVTGAKDGIRVRTFQPVYTPGFNNVGWEADRRRSRLYGDVDYEVALCAASKASRDRASLEELWGGFDAAVEAEVQKRLETAAAEEKAKRAQAFAALPARARRLHLSGLTEKPG